MYSLPISTYSDYWRATKFWSIYIGWLAVFATGTRYSVLGAPDKNQMILPTFQQITQSSKIKKSETEISFIDPRKKVFSFGTVSRGVSPQQGEISPSSVSIQGEASPREASQGLDRRSSKIEIVYQDIPFDTQYVESDKLLPGKVEIREKGEKGISRQVVKTFEVDGKISNQQVQSSFEFKSPKTEVIVQNSKPIPKKKVIFPDSMPATEEGLELAKMNSSQTLNVVSTAYTYTGNKTATGVEPRQGLIAVDPNLIAMGSKVYVEGYGYAIAADTGGSIHGNRIDVFFPTLRQCIDWGRKTVHIYVMKPS